METGGEDHRCYDVGKTRKQDCRGRMLILRRNSHHDVRKCRANDDSNGSINCYAQIEGVDYPLSNALLHGSKGNLKEYYTNEFPDNKTDTFHLNKKLDLCINFTYPHLFEGTLFIYLM